jgi:preprotein translocase subunit YajC
VLYLFQFNAFFATATPNAQANPIGALASLLPFLILIPLMYFLMIRPQKKKQKEEQKMRNSLRVGDEITTIGGITGRVLNIKEDVMVIETGADRSKMTIKKWALQSVDTIHDNDDIDDDDDDDDDDI